MKTKKQDKTVPIFGLKKVNNKTLIKMMSVELGKLHSYIDELEDKVKRQQSKINELEHKAQAYDAFTSKEKNQAELALTKSELHRRARHYKLKYDELLAEVLKRKESTADCY